MGGRETGGESAAFRNHPASERDGSPSQPEGKGEPGDRVRQRARAGPAPAGNIS